MKGNGENEPIGLGILELLLGGGLDSIPGGKKIQEKVESCIIPYTHGVSNRINDVIGKRGFVVSYKEFAKYFSENLQGNNFTVQEDIRSYFSFLFPWITAGKKLNWGVYHDFVTDINNLSSVVFPSKGNFNISKQGLLEVIRHMIESDITNNFLSSINGYSKVVALLYTENQKKEKRRTRTIKTPE